MNLQTQISIKKESKNLIDYQSEILLLGSCFSENIGNKLSYYKFRTTQNPFGILFHSAAIENLITNSINKKTYSAKDIFFQNERWHCFEGHSDLSSNNEITILKKLNSAISITERNLKNTTHIIITLGTSWVYRHIESDSIVANCHKVPQKKFLKELLAVDEITESLDAVIQLIKSVNKNATVLFTVSPIRHLKDGFIENTRSKSHLIAAIHAVIDNRKNIHYYPAYEIMMDELRDYRFYAEDMIHPNTTAINYIWEKFTNTWFSEATIPVIKEVDHIQKGIAHRPFNENSNEHQKFLENLQSKKTKLQEQFPFINF